MEIVPGCQVECRGETRMGSRVRRCGGGKLHSSPGAETGAWHVLGGPLIQQLQPWAFPAASPKGPLACKGS